MFGEEIGNLPESSLTSERIRSIFYCLLPYFYLRSPVLDVRPAVQAFGHQLYSNLAARLLVSRRLFIEFLFKLEISDRPTRAHFGVRVGV